MIVALIDADSIVYTVAYRFKDQEESLDSSILLQTQVDTYVTDILKATRAEKYLGVLSSKECFRHREYKFAPYKGNRPPKPEFMVKWEGEIVKRLIEHWGFIVAEDLEADDVVAFLQSALNLYSEFPAEPIVCSPDKDLRQNPGQFYDYTKDCFETIVPEDATRRFYSSLVTGDTGDNIKGLFGVGPVKAAKLFSSCESEIDCEIALEGIYKDYFGSYSSEILKQTRDAIQMLSPSHSHWAEYSSYLISTRNLIKDCPITLPELPKLVNLDDIFKD